MTADARAPTRPNGAGKPSAGKGGGSQSGGPAAGSRRRGGRRSSSRAPVFAALDLGTNNCRLLVARAERHGFTVIDAFSRIVRLGEGLAETGALSEAAMDRAVAALGICAERIEKHRVVGMRAIATEACRRASNCDDFIERVRARTGLAMDVISPAEEARLAVAGCAPLVDPKAETLLVFDIGGGSTELIGVDLSATPPPKKVALLTSLALRDRGPGRIRDRALEAQAKITDWMSVPAGVVTLGEKFDRIIDDVEKFEAMRGHIADMIAPFIERACPPTRQRLAKLQVLGTSGTITTLAGVHLDLERYSRRAVDGLWVASAAVDRVIERLLDMNGYERAAIPCVGEDRAGNLMSGAAIMRAILHAWPTRRLRVADRGLREGMLYGLIQEHHQQ